MKKWLSVGSQSWNVKGAYQNREPKHILT